MKKLCIVFIQLLLITYVVGENEYTRIYGSRDRRFIGKNIENENVEVDLLGDNLRIPKEDSAMDDINFNPDAEYANKFFQHFGSERELQDETQIKHIKPKFRLIRNVNDVPFPNKLIYYTFINFSPDLHPSEIRQTIRQAFDIWSAVIPRDFIEVSPHDKFAQIKIQFARGHHGDMSAFDGKGNVLAHAISGGYVHFDGDEKWKIHKLGEKYDYSKTDLLSVAIHEIGHSLGLRRHLNARDSIMQSTSQNYVDEKGNYVMPELSKADILEIQGIYGPRLRGDRNGGGVVNGPKPPAPRPPPQRPYLPPTPFPPQRYIPLPPYQPQPPRQQPPVHRPPYQPPPQNPLPPLPPRKQPPPPRRTSLPPPSTTLPPTSSIHDCSTSWFCKNNIPRNNAILNFFQQICDIVFYNSLFILCFCFLFIIVFFVLKTLISVFTKSAK